MGVRWLPKLILYVLLIKLGFLCVPVTEQAPFLCLLP